MGSNHEQPRSVDEPDRSEVGIAVATSPTGEKLTKPQYIDALVKLLTVEGYKLNPVAVHVYGDAAVAVYRVAIKATVPRLRDDQKVAMRQVPAARGVPAPCTLWSGHLTRS